MSRTTGEYKRNTSTLIFYTNEMTATKRVLIELRNKNLFDVVEIQGVSFQHRWRKGSAMEE